MPYLYSFAHIEPSFKSSRVHLHDTKAVKVAMHIISSSAVDVVQTFSRPDVKIYHDRQLVVCTVQKV